MTRPAGVEWSVLDRDGDPVPGDSTVIEEIRSAYESLASVTQEAHDLLVSGSEIAGGQGAAMEAFRDLVGKLPGRLGGMAESYRRAAESLRGYVPSLDEAQSMSLRALEQAQEAAAAQQAVASAVAGAEAAIAAAGSDAAAQERAQGDAAAARGRAAEAQAGLDRAKALLGQAEALRDTAASAGARTLRELADDAPRRSLWEKIVEAFRAFVEFLRSTVMEWIVTVLDVLATLASFIFPPLGSALGALAGGIEVLSAVLGGDGTEIAMAFAGVAVGLVPGGRLVKRVAGAIGDAIPGTAKNGVSAAARGLAGGGGRTVNGALPASARAAGNRPPVPKATAVSLDLRKCVTDPVDVASGEMVFRHVDLELPAPLGLVLERTHVSSYRAGGMFGPTWASTLDQRLEFDAEGTCWFAPDGMILVYPAAAPGSAVLPEEGPRLPLTVYADRSAALTDPRTGRTSFFRNLGTASWLWAIEDRRGNRVEIDRDDHGMPTALRHPAGYRVEIAADGDRVTALRVVHGDESALVATFGYDEHGHLAEITNPAGEPSRLTYDDEGRILAWQDRSGDTYRYTYDADGQCIATAGAGGFLDAALTFDRASSTTSYTDSLGNVTGYRLNEANQVVAETDPLGATTQYEWNRYHRLLSRTDPLGRTTAFEYDDEGEPVVVIRPDGSRVSLRRAAPGEEPRLEIAVTDTDTGITWRRTYTGAHVPDPLQVPIGISGTPGFEDEDPIPGRALTGPGETWSDDGAVRERVRPGGGVERWRYDGEGNEVEHVDPAGGVTRSEFGMFGLRTAELDQAGERTTYGYDTELRLTTVTTPGGLTWHYGYDAAGRVTEETDFDGRTTRYTYDAAGQLVRTTTPAGEHIDYTYDLLGNRIRRETPTGVTNYRYDPVGRLVAAAGPDAMLVVDRDTDGRVLAQTVNGRSVVFDYDDENGATVRRTPGGVASVWRYDEDGRPELLATAGHVVGFGHDEADRETIRDVDGARILEQTYDADGRLHEQRLAGGHERRYRRRADGTPVALDDTVTGHTEVELDAAGRVVELRTPTHTERYGYDDLGNVTTSELDGRDVPEAGPRRYSGTSLLAAGAVSYAYDALGRRTERTVRRDDGTEQTWHYEWDTLDRLLAVTTPDGTYWRYRYDPLGRRIAKQRLADRDPEQVLEEVRYTWDGTTLIEQEHARPDGVRFVTSWTHHPGDGRPVTQTEHLLPAGGPAPEAQAFRTIVPDTVDAPALLADTAGRVVGQARTTLWGLGDGGGTVLRFPGQLHDHESGLHYNVYRYYDPAAGRYVSPDPLGLEPAPNPVAYVGNPMVATDPLGLTSPCKAGSSSRKRKRVDVAMDVDAAAGTAAGRPAKRPNTGTPVIKTGKYSAGQHGNRQNEQAYLGEKFGQRVHGASGSEKKGNRIEATHESEHTIGYEVLGGRSNLPRGTPIAKGGEHVQRVENTAPAYQEVAEAHRKHIGTGMTVETKKELYVDVGADGKDVTFEAPAGYGYNARDYRAHQAKLLDQDDLSSATQLNQLGYAHTPAFRESKGKLEATIADDSYTRMVDNMTDVERFTGKTTTSFVPRPDASGRTEMFLAREAANTGEWPNDNRRIEILNYFLDRENGIAGLTPPVMRSAPSPVAPGGRPSPGPASPMDVDPS